MDALEAELGQDASWKVSLLNHLHWCEKQVSSVKANSWYILGRKGGKYVVCLEFGFSWVLWQPGAVPVLEGLYLFSPRFWNVVGFLHASLHCWENVVLWEQWLHAERLSWRMQTTEMLEVPRPSPHSGSAKRDFHLLHFFFHSFFLNVIKMLCVCHSACRRNNSLWTRSSCLFFLLSVLSVHTWFEAVWCFWQSNYKGRFSL